MWRSLNQSRIEDNIHSVASTPGPGTSRIRRNIWELFEAPGKMNKLNENG